VGFDTRTGVEHQILPGPHSYAQPVLTPDARRVLYTDLSACTGKGNASEECDVFVVDWDGRNRRKFTDGHVYCVKTDPRDGLTWVYVGNIYNGGNLVNRHRLDDPSVKELVWDKSKVDIRFQVTDDCRLVGGQLPRDVGAGIATIPNGQFRKIGWGCNTSLAPDGSIFFHQIGSHREIILYDANGGNKRKIALNNAPGVGGHQVWNPTFTTDRQFMTMTAPWPQLHRAKADVYFGKFNESHTAIDSWVLVTDFPAMEAGAYAWIGPAEAAPSISIHPSDQVVDEGETATFSVEADGSPAPTFQWQRNGANIPGATKNSYTVTGGREETDAEFRCVVKNSEGRATSNAATLTVNLKGPSPEQIAEWDAKLLAMVRESLKSGKKASLNPGSRSRRRPVKSVDADGKLIVEMMRGMEVGIPWERLSADDKAGLAVSIVREGRSADHCLAAFYLPSADRRAEATAHLKKGGKEADTIRSAFE
jgi:hypothetical protein